MFGWFWLKVASVVSQAISPLAQKVTKMSLQLDTLTADESALKDAITTLIQQDSDNTDALKALIAKGGNVPPDDLAPLIAQSEATRQAVIDALTRNTPPVAAPVEPPADSGSAPAA